MESNDKLLLHLHQQTKIEESIMETTIPYKAPQTFSEMWEVIKDKLIATVTFKGKSYTKEEFHQLAKNS